ncbi:MAG: hypothetical protein AAF582_10745 [Pseudomonadota bacterium]
MRIAFLGVAIAVATPVATAQNTSGVFGPVIDDGERGWEYRFSYDPDDKDFNQRFHYQQAISGALRWRIIAQVRSTDDSDFDPDFLRGEMVWQVSPDDQAYQTGFRFEGRYRFDDRPGDVTVHWINQWRHVDDWTFRFIIGATQQIGNDPADGILMQTRSSATTSVPGGPKLGLEWFGEYGSTSDWLGFDDQEHQIGPVAVWDVGNDWSLYTGALFGATDATPDAELRFRLTREY